MNVRNARLSLLATAFHDLALVILAALLGPAASGPLAWIGFAAAICAGQLVLGWLR